MKKRLIFAAVLLACIALAACNSENEEENTEAEGNESQEAVEDTELDSEVEENEESGETEDSNENDSSGSGPFEVTEEDQLDLRVGDTGLVETSIGTYELTVESAEILGAELGGQETPLEEIILLELTFENIGDDIIIAEDIMSMLEISPLYDGSGYSNAAEVYDGIEEFTGEIQPGEERKTQFIADMMVGDEYYFRQLPGRVAAGVSNQVIWTISDEEARN
ncbi:hypothetical protein [Virgibacillus sp. YIM 98842]|uniref:hypothetical protein n=1 Tax=Virgibacillus sp. YIM 98842 TaxID=2663533 RepID=UPI0013DAB4A2|nr:hypothetical protein [Virgibacillus sp. YIM 98842]